MVVRAEYIAVTPVYMAGANHHPEFRLVSYVKMLRWWWRFLALGRFGSAESASHWEAVTFGWHEKPYGRGAARFQLDWIDEALPKHWEADSFWKGFSGVGYLTAQSFKADKDGAYPIRKAAPVRAFGVWMDWRLAGECTHKAALARKTLIDAMALIGLIGGLGARSRRGFGSLAIINLAGDEVVDPAISGLPNSAEAYVALVKIHLGTEKHVGEPPYTALSDQTKIRICAEGSSDEQRLMNEIGWAFQIYRSWGQSDGAGGHQHNFLPGGHKLAAGAAKKDWYKLEFSADHNEFYAKLGDEVSFTDNRSIFGLPHNYFRFSDKKKIDVGWNIQPASFINKRDFDRFALNFERRSSPLFFHFHRLNNNSVIFISLIVPAAFLPAAAFLSVSEPVNLREWPGPVNWEILEDFPTFVRSPSGTAVGGSGGGVANTTYAPKKTDILP